MTNDFKSLIHRKKTLTLLASNPNMSKMPMNPSVACLTAELSTVMDLEALTPPEPIVDACWLLFSIFREEKRMHRPTTKATISIRLHKKLWWFLNFYLSSLILLSLILLSLLSLLELLLFYFFIWSLLEVWIFHVLCVLKSTLATLWHNSEINHPYILENLRCTKEYQNVTRLSSVMAHQTASLSCSIMIFNFDKALCE